MRSACPGEFRTRGVSYVWTHAGYAALGSAPTLPAAAVAALVADVNARNDFSGFVRAVRAAFAALCERPAGRAA